MPEKPGPPAGGEKGAGKDAEKISAPYAETNEETGKKPAITVGYARCSTDPGKQDIGRQERELRAMGAAEIYGEYAGGADPGRPGLKKALAALPEGGTLAATEVSRVARRLGKLLEVMAEAGRKKARLRFGSAEFDFSSGRASPMQLAMLQMMGVFAELELNLTAERISSGLANARANGKRLGRPKKAAADVPPEAVAMKAAIEAGETTKAACARALGVSRPTLDKWLGLLGGERDFNC